MEAYYDYEKEIMTADIAAFAAENGLSVSLVSRVLHQFFTDPRSITKNYLMEVLRADGVKGIIKIDELAKKLLQFLEDCYNKYAAEGK